MNTEVKMRLVKGEIKKELLKRLGLKEAELTKFAFEKPKSDKGI